MQPDTCRRITYPLAARSLHSCTSSPTDLNALPVARAPVSLFNSLHTLLIVAIVALLACLSACGPVPSDEASSVGASANAGGGLTPVPASRDMSVPLGTGTVAGGKGDSPRAEPVPFSMAASPAPLAASRSLNHEPASDTQAEPPLPDYLVLPEWIAKELDSPKVPVRLQALDRWAQQARPSIDPLVVALDDDDEDVRAKAMAIIERQWAVEPERGSEQ